jgi:hypothetical protein
LKKFKIGICDIGTPDKKETRSDNVRKSLGAAIGQLSARLGGRPRQMAMETGAHHQLRLLGQPESLQDG